MRRWLLIAQLLAAQGWLVACAGARGPLITHPAKLTWPPTPAKARIAYVGQIRGTRSGGAAAAVLAGEAPLKALSRPYAVAAGRGLLVVTDAGRGEVNLFDLVRQSHRRIAEHGDQPLISPVGAALDARGRVFVADSTARRIFVFDANGEPLTSYGGALQRPTGLAIDRKRGVLYVADTVGHRIHVRSVDGKYLFGFGRRGVAAGEFNFPTHLFFSAATGQLLVCDTMNFRIQRFDRRGRALGMFGRLGDASGALAKPKGVAVDSQGHIYVSDALYDRIQIFDAEGRLLLYFGGPGQGRGNLAMPTGLFIDAEDRIFVANTLRRRIEVFRYLGGRKDEQPTKNRR